MIELITKFDVLYLTGCFLCYGHQVGIDVELHRLLRIEKIKPWYKRRPTSQLIFLFMVLLSWIGLFRILYISYMTFGKAPFRLIHPKTISLTEDSEP